MQQITSKKNDIIKETKKLQTKKYRKKNQEYLIEGLHLIDEALKYNVEIVNVFATDKFRDHRIVKKYFDQTYEITEEIAEEISDTKTPQGIFAIAKIDESNTEIDFKDRWLLLDNVQDPGNVGTIIRTADAAGFKGVLIGDNTADIYQGKVQRSMQGSQFHIKIQTSDSRYLIEEFLDHSVPVWASEVNKSAKPITDLASPNDVLIIMGNEANGLNKEILNLATEQVYIPILGQAESLNVAIAAAVLMYQVTLNS